MYKLVLIRHGQSEWNLTNRFTGWKDVDLTELGVEEAERAAQSLIDAGFTFDQAYTSVLKRAIKTLNLVLDKMNLDWIPVEKAWQLNERHYGALQGLNKSETVEKYGEEQVKIWRRSYDTLPPLLDKKDERYPGKDPRYKNLSEEQLPLAESLKTTLARVLPYWEQNIAHDIRTGKSVVVVAHGNSIRALVKHLDLVPENEITELNIPTGIPLVYELEANLKPIRHYYLGDPAMIQAELDKVAAQGKKK